MGVYVSNDQHRANIVRTQCQDFVHRLRTALGSADESAVPILDKLRPRENPTRFVDELHAQVCEQLGIRAEASNLRSHPWSKSGWARKSP